MKMENESKFILLCSVFITLMIFSSVVGIKLVSFFGIVFAVGTITISLSFPITDAICDVWGKRQTKKLVISGLLCWLLLLGLIFFAIKIPPASFWPLQESYAKVFTSSIRITVAGLVGYTVSQFHDIWAFMYWKKKTNGKYLWLRNNLSTAVSQLLLTVIIVFIGFYGDIPDKAILSTIYGWRLIKEAIAIADTPLVYALVRWARK